MVQLALIGPGTRLRGRLFQSAYGTAPTVATAASGLSTTGATCSTITCATIAYNSVMYCRSVANRGIYRAVSSASATIHTFTKAFPYTIVAGDTFVFGPRPGPNAIIQMDAANQYIDVAADATANNFRITVLRTNLEVAGEEYVDFMFSTAHFLGILAAS